MEGGLLFSYPWCMTPFPWAAKVPREREGGFSPPRLWSRPRASAFLPPSCGASLRARPFFFIGCTSALGPGPAHLFPLLRGLTLGWALGQRTFSLPRGQARRQPSRTYVL